MLPRTIVYVLDSSGTVTDPTLTWASSLARWYGSDLHVVHVRGSGRGTAAARIARREELLGRITRIAEASGVAGVNVAPAALRGRPVRAIAEYSRRVAADLVVVTNRPRRRSGYWLAGSFAAALGKAVASPTIALPERLGQTVGPSGPFRKIVTAIDFSDVSFRALSEALSLAQLSGGSLKLVHALNGFPSQIGYGRADALRMGRAFRASAARINRELQSMVPSDALNWSAVDAVTVPGLADEAILVQASAERADLIVLGLPRRSRLEELVAGSTAHRVLGRARSPVLLVPGPSTSRRLALAAGHARWLSRSPSTSAVNRVEGAEAASWR